MSNDVAKIAADRVVAHGRSSGRRGRGFAAVRRPSRRTSLVLGRIGVLVGLLAAWQLCAGTLIGGGHHRPSSPFRIRWWASWVTEFLAGSAGLGFLLASNANQFNAPGTYAAVFVLAAISFALDRLTALATKRPLMWKEAGQRS
jgi:hypothetical protein